MIIRLDIMNSGQEFMEEIFMKKHAHSRKLLQKNQTKITFLQKTAHIYKPKITNILKVIFLSDGTSY